MNRSEMYSDLLKVLSKEIDHYFSRIEANYNFDLGPEFEIALCRLFQKVLPSRFGVCRGFIIDKKGNKVGDDIIIYDKLRFPTLRFLDEDFAQKECIPFEAVYAYFEVKHNLELDINAKEKSTFDKAIEQLQKLEKLDRQKRGINQILDHATLKATLSVRSIPGWPDYFNPLLKGIISRKVSFKEDDDKENMAKGILDKEQSFKYLCKKMEQGGIGYLPDLIVAGSDILAVPLFNNAKHSNIVVPFAGKAMPLKVVKTRDSTFNALALAICNTLRALEFIQLGSMPWEEVLFNGIEDEHKKKN